jgi:hypothetical protein
MNPDTDFPNLKATLAGNGSHVEWPAMREEVRRVFALLSDLRNQVAMFEQKRKLLLDGTKYLEGENTRLRGYAVLAVETFRTIKECAEGPAIADLRLQRCRALAMDALFKASTASIPTGVPEPKVDHVFPLYPDTRQEAHEISTQSEPTGSLDAFHAWLKGFDLDAYEQLMGPSITPGRVHEYQSAFFAGWQALWMAHGSRHQRWVEPEGWKLVPVEPTVVQANAGVDADDMRTGFEKHLYRAMVKAAPPAPGCEYRT